MSGKHTPGPWEARNGSDIYVIEATSPDGTLIHSEICYAYMDDNEGEHWANANLIAAAPDLLAALEALFPHSPNEGAIRVSAAKRAIVRAAIAKARGSR